MTGAASLTWGVCAAAVAGMIVRPLRSPEALWPVLGAVVLFACGLMPVAAVGTAIGNAADVCLFLLGMMLLSEVAREQGVFDWLAAIAVARARGSAPRLFLLTYAAGVVTTTFLSNDATAVVLTPAVYAAARRAGAQPLPLLFACALVANAASFVLPISNPANLVLYGGHLPPLGPWFASFAAPSLAAVLVTFVALRWVERRRIAGRCAVAGAVPRLSPGGAIALAAIAATAVLLIAASALAVPLGWPTALAGTATLAIVTVATRGSPVPALRAVAWSVLPLVSGLFVLVEALDRTGVVALLAARLGQAAAASPMQAAGGAGALLAVACNLVNNLPAGLLAGTAATQAGVPRLVIDGLLIGVDLGPNLSITGSLATILWLQAIRREGEDVGFLAFLRVGVLTMPPALAAALAVRLMIG